MHIHATSPNRVPRRKDHTQQSFITVKFCYQLAWVFNCATSGNGFSFSLKQKLFSTECLVRLVALYWYHSYRTTNIYSKPLLPHVYHQSSIYEVCAGIPVFQLVSDFGNHRTIRWTSMDFKWPLIFTSSPDSKHQWSNSLQTWTTLAIISFRSQGPSLFLSGVFSMCWTTFPKMVVWWKSSFTCWTFKVG